jgi:hypothetical protein
MNAQDWAIVITAAAAAVATVLGAIGALWAKVDAHQRQIDGRLDQLLAVTASAARAAGKLDAETRS